MAYNINGKVYTDHALMDEVVFHTKNILKDIVLKNQSKADEAETELSVELSFRTVLYYLLYTTNNKSYCHM